MKVVFEIADIERVYNRDAESSHGYIQGKLEKANNNYKAFYGELDYCNRRNFTDLVGIPSPEASTLYVEEKLEGTDYKIINVLPLYERNHWCTEVTWINTSTESRYTYNVWFEQGGIYGEW